MLQVLKKIYFYYNIASDVFVLGKILNIWPSFVGSKG